MGAPFRGLLAAGFSCLLAALLAGCWGGKAETADPSNPRTVIAEMRPSGELEFLRRDYKAARAPLTAAAETGSLRAIYFLRILTETGLDGQPGDPDEAHRLLSLLAASENTLTNLATRGPSADRPIYKSALATLWLRGYLEPVPEPLRGINYALAAVDEGLLSANNLASAILLDPRSETFMTKFWDNRKEKAWELTKQAAEAGDVLAMGNASYLARNGIGTPLDPYLGAAWARKAANLPEATGRCLNDLGFYYERGLAVTQDLTEAGRWYSLAASKGSALAQSNLSRLNSKGAGAPEVFEGMEY